MRFWQVKYPYGFGWLSLVSSTQGDGAMIRRKSIKKQAWKSLSGTFFHTVRVLESLLIGGDPAILYFRVFFP